MESRMSSLGSRMSSLGSTVDDEESDAEEDWEIEDYAKQIRCCLLSYLGVVALFVLFGLWSLAPLVNNVGEWIFFPTSGLPEATAPDFSVPDRCPCHCRKNDRDLISIAARDAAACTPGRVCLYGDSWCRAKDHEPPGLPAKGHCLQGECDGPYVHYDPRESCREPEEAGDIVLPMLRALPDRLMSSLQSAEAASALLEQVLKFHGLSDVVSLSMDEAFFAVAEADSAMREGLSLKFTEVWAKWVADCWPSERYGVLTGSLSIPRGTVSIGLRGSKFTLTFEDFRVDFNQLRADLQCHWESFVLGNFGSGGSLGSLDPLREDTFKVSGSLLLDCAPSWSPSCWLLHSRQKEMSEHLIARAPAVVSSWLQLVRNVDLGGTCPAELHNTLPAKPYVRQECCEAPIALDDTGCLVGGQFEMPNVDPFRDPPHVECTKVSGHWRGRCDKLPGKYRYDFDKDVCIEHELLPDPYRCDHCRAGLDAMLDELQEVTVGLRVLVLALAMLAGLGCFLCLPQRWYLCAFGARTPALLRSGSIE